MDLFALPSYANEGVPQAILQAMACGVPVITTDAGAIGEVAHEATDAAPATACIVRKEQADDLRDAILAIKDDASRRDRLARDALELVRARHGIEGMLDRMEGVFQAAARGTRPVASNGESR